MGRVPSAFLSLMTYVAFSLYAGVAAGDPVRVTSGSLLAYGRVGEIWDAEDLQITAPGVYIQNSLEEGEFLQLAKRPLVAPGAFVDWSGVLQGSPYGLGFSMSFDAEPTRLACSSPALGFILMSCSAVAPIRFYADHDTFHIIGRGTANGTLDLLSSGTAFGWVTYTFDSSAVPEPATITLFSNGALLTGACIWRRRRRR